MVSCGLDCGIDEVGMPARRWGTDAFDMTLPVVKVAHQMGYLVEHDEVNERNNECTPNLIGICLFQKPLPNRKNNIFKISVKQHRHV